MVPFKAVVFYFFLIRNRVVTKLIFEAVNKLTKNTTPTTFLRLPKRKRKRKRRKKKEKIMAIQNKARLMVMAVIAVAMATMSLTDAQNVQSCASKLVPCYSSLNSTSKPNSECCNSIKEAVAKELPCLCTLYNTPGLLSSFNVSVADALRISRDCNVPTDLSSCNSKQTLKNKIKLQFIILIVILKKFRKSSKPLDLFGFCN